MSSEQSGPQSPSVTMEARTVWLLVVVVLALGSSSSTGQYVGLCEYPSDPLPVGGREEEGLGGRVGAQDTEEPGWGLSVGLRKLTKLLNLMIATLAT